MPWLHNCCGEWEGGPFKPLSNHNDWMAVVAPADRPKSDRNSCVIQRIWSVFGSFHLCIFCRLEVFYHTSASDLFPFSFSYFIPNLIGWYFQYVNFRTYIKWKPYWRLFAFWQILISLTWLPLLVIRSVSDALRAQSRLVKFVGGEAAGRTPYTFYKPTLDPKYVRNIPYNEFITSSTFIYSIIGILMDCRYRFMTLGTPWTQSMPSRDVNTATRLAEASWRRDKYYNPAGWKRNTHMYINISRIYWIYFHRGFLVILWLKNDRHSIDFISFNVKCPNVVKLGDNTFVIEWFAGINCIILWSQI